MVFREHDFEVSDEQYIRMKWIPSKKSMWAGKWVPEGEVCEKESRRMEVTTTL